MLSESYISNLKPNNKMPRSINIIVEKKDVLSGDISRVSKIFNYLESHPNLAAQQGRYIITFPCFDNDPRDNYLIPEIRNFLSALFNSHPHLFFYMSSEPTVGMIQLHLKSLLPLKFLIISQDGNSADISMSADEFAKVCAFLLKPTIEFSSNLGINADDILEKFMRIRPELKSSVWQYLIVKMKPNPPYVLIELASEQIPILGPNDERITQYRIPSVLTREQAVGKLHRGFPCPSLVPVFYNCLESIANPLIPGSPSVRKLGVFPGRDPAMLEWAVECVQLAGELVHGEPSHRLFFPGTHYGEALAALMEEARRGRPIVLDGFDFLTAMKEVEQHEATMKAKNLPFSVASDLYCQDDPSGNAFAYHLTQIIEIADGEREELTLQTKKGEITLRREDVKPGFYVAVVCKS